MFIRTCIALLALTAALAVPGTASATTIEDCQSQISALRTDTAAVTTFANAKDQAGLLAKLDAASAALAAGKNAGAVNKLTDVRTKVQTLGATGKLAAEDAARLDAAAAAAIGCIESIGAWLGAPSRCAPGTPRAAAGCARVGALLGELAKRGLALRGGVFVRKTAGRASAYDTRAGDRHVSTPPVPTAYPGARRFRPLA